MKSNEKTPRRSGLPKSFLNMKERRARIDAQAELDEQRVKVIEASLEEQVQRGEPISLEQIPEAHELSERGGLLWESILRSYRRLKEEQEKDTQELVSNHPSYHTK
jgi:hypothetical protein